MAEIVSIDLTNIPEKEMARIAVCLGLSTPEEIADYLEEQLISIITAKEIRNAKIETRKNTKKLKLKQP